MCFVSSVTIVLVWQLRLRREWCWTRRRLPLVSAGARLFSQRTCADYSSRDWWRMLIITGEEIKCKISFSRTEQYVRNKVNMSRQRKGEKHSEKKTRRYDDDDGEGERRKKWKKRAKPRKEEGKRKHRANEYVQEENHRKRKRYLLNSEWFLLFSVVDQNQIQVCQSPNDRKMTLRSCLLSSVYPK